VRAVLVLFFILSVGGAALADGGQPPRFRPNEGEVLYVDKEAGEIAIRHGDLPELGMEPMSMAFKVADLAMLERVKKGDRVKFKAGLVEGRFAILSIERVRSLRKPTERLTK